MHFRLYLPSERQISFSPSADTNSRPASLLLPDLRDDFSPKSRSAGQNAAVPKRGSAGARSSEESGHAAPLSFPMSAAQPISIGFALRSREAKRRLLDAGVNAALAADALVEIGTARAITKVQLAGMCGDGRFL